MELLKVGGILFLLVILAFLVETLTEFLFGDLFDKFPKLVKFRWTIKYLAIAIGIVGTFHYRIDLIHEVSLILQTDPSIAVSWYGIGITGVAVGKGSNYLHQFISKYLPAK